MAERSVWTDLIDAGLDKDGSEEGPGIE